MAAQDRISRLHRAIEYDAARNRLWLFGQRCHHGAGGAVLTAAAIGGLAGARVSARAVVTLVTAGSMLMVHDWKDRGMWFERGRGNQP